MATRCLALALAPTIRVNAVAPGYLDEPQPPAESLLARVPLQRAGRYADVVEAVLFLAGSAAYTTGEVLAVDGGRGWAWSAHAAAAEGTHELGGSLADPLRISSRA